MDSKDLGQLADHCVMLLIWIYTGSFGCPLHLYLIRIHLNHIQDLYSYPSKFTSLTDPDLSRPFTRSVFSPFPMSDHSHRTFTVFPAWGSLCCPSYLQSHCRRMSYLQSHCRRMYPVRSSICSHIAEGCTQLQADKLQCFLSSLSTCRTYLSVGPSRTWLASPVPFADFQFSPFPFSV